MEKEDELWIGNPNFSKERLFDCIQHDKLLKLEPVYMRGCAKLNLQTYFRHIYYVSLIYFELFYKFKYNKIGKTKFHKDLNELFESHLYFKEVQSFEIKENLNEEYNDMLNIIYNYFEENDIKYCKIGEYMRSGN